MAGKARRRNRSELTDGVKKKENFNLLHEGFPKPGTSPTVDIGVLWPKGLVYIYIYREKNSPYLHQIAI